MMTEKYKVRVIVTACMLAMASLGSIATAQPASPTGSSPTQATTEAPAARDEAAAMKHVDDAVAAVRRMESEPGMSNLLQQAKGVFIVPTYGRAALGVGGSGGAGVLLVKRDGGTWSDPVFYNVGSISVGLQAGAESGPIALVLNNDKAVNSFMQQNNFSLSADAGLTIVDWAKTAQGTAGTGDVVAWSGAKGLFGNVASIGVSDVRFNQGQTNAYYGQNVAASDVVDGKVKNPQADMLKQALAATAAGADTATGSSGAAPSRGAAGNDASGGGSEGTGTYDGKK